MKNKFLLTLVLVTSMSIASFTQRGEIKLYKDPSKSMGYTIWENNRDVAYYQLNILESLSSDRYEILNSIRLSTNYCRIDPLLFTIPNRAYEIVGYAADGSISESTGPIQAIGPNPGHVPVIGCTKKCNGNSYAFSLTEYTPVLATYLDENGEEAFVLGNKRLISAHTGFSYNPVTAVWTPYYQAIDILKWEQMSGHPYKQISSYGVPLYENFALNASPFAYWDKNGVPVLEGRLVEKMDQYEHFNNVLTDENAAAPEVSVGRVVWQ